ncbi:hypothetical protein L7F22_050600 [Adiantum nelumboides]|nr:hypothetical protein [Adiantum nelumboides]
MSGRDMAKNHRPISITVEGIFEAHKGRRHGMLRALITERNKLYQLCDPACENLCLYSFPDGNWKVSKPADEIPSELPEPCIGINFLRDGMDYKDWFSLVSAHSDSWLFAVTFFYAAAIGTEERARLFDMINDLPTLHEVVTGQAFMTQMEAQPAHTLHQEVDERNADDDVGEEEDGEETYCGACGGSYSSSKSKFWILCDTCKKWFHGKCVKMTLAMADRIDKYKCPACARKRQHV